ncbi:MAG: hypothetical protein RI964_1369 [Pseudomonadota bacterium]|jgi:3-deoxy-D-manno-octulosonic acid kinase
MHLITRAQTTYAISPHAVPQFQTEQFEPSWWRARNTITGQSVGRGTTWFLRLEDKELVLRHYYRGGLVGQLLGDRYLFNGIHNSRAVVECELLINMQHQGLPVPKPWAVRIQRSGIFYRMDILLERIHQAQDLVHLLRQQALTAAQWQMIGQTIRRFHQAGIDHADLNAHNILMDQAQQAWLIDFDKGRQRSAGKWQQHNLDRLLRSLRKEAALHTVFNWQPADWQALLAGYQRFQIPDSPR